MAPLIRAVLSNLFGAEAADEIEIIANDVTVFPDGKWEIQFRHPSRSVTTTTRRRARHTVSAVGLDSH
jgi:2-hydroxy-3-keto-5-methylthiopentenyl-1-phosphate phosphatase